MIVFWTCTITVAFRAWRLGLGPGQNQVRAVTQILDRLEWAFMSS